MKNFLGISLFLSLLSANLTGQDFPEPMQPPRLVNDFAGLLQTDEVYRLNDKLLAFNDSTSTQIYIVTVTDLHGYDPSEYAIRLGQKWGIGQKGKDNGVLILVKPKTAREAGQLFIAVGQGLEGVLTDAQANRISDLTIIPRFKEGDNYGGLSDGVDIIMAITAGEYTADHFLKKAATGNKRGSIIGVIVFAIIMSALFGGGKRMNRHNNIGRSNLPFWLLLGMMGSGRNTGSFGGFSSGGGFGGFGGFGGGGGGSFGGGGAGGSW